MKLGFLFSFINEKFLNRLGIIYTTLIRIKLQQSVAFLMR